MLSSQSKFSILLLLVFSALVSCDSESNEFLETEGGLKYKFHDIVDEGRTPKSGDFLSVYISWSSKDSIYYNSVNTFDPINLIVLGETKNGGLEEGFFKLKEGDSASFYIEPEKLYSNYLNQPLPEALKNEKELNVSIRLLKVQTEKEYYNSLKISKEQQEIHEISMVKNKVDDWKKQYDSVFTYSGCYMVYLSPFIGDTIQKGNEVTIQYSASFFNGDEFYSTEFNGVPETYLVGSKDQTVDGLQIAFLHMSYGQRAKIIVPSYMGFGEKGSAGGIVPPFTPIVYEIEVLDNK